jgi:hypothetical protein
MPSTQVPFARFVKQDDSQAYEVVIDHDGRVSTVSTDDAPPPMIDEAAAEKVQGIYSMCDTDTKKVVGALSTLALGQSGRQTMGRERSAHELGMSLQSYDHSTKAVRHKAGGRNLKHGREIITVLAARPGIAFSMRGDREAVLRACGGEERAGLLRLRRAYVMRGARD